HSHVAKHPFLIPRAPIHGARISDTVVFDRVYLSNKCRWPLAAGARWIRSNSLFPIRVTTEFGAPTNHRLRLRAAPDAAQSDSKLGKSIHVANDKDKLPGPLERPSCRAEPVWRPRSTSSVVIPRRFRGEGATLHRPE